ncbi:MAG: NADH-quinone oxidoreductase subunit C [Acidimicrobiales bacterium]
MADDTTTDPTPEVVTDDRREALLAVLSEHLGEAVLDHHLRPGQGLWIRVANEAWATAAEVASAKAGLTFFDFLSAIDWLPSPYGRYEDSALDVPFPPPMPDRSSALPGLAGGDTRMQVLASLAKPGTDERVLLKADVDDDDPRIATWIHTFAGAAWHERETHEMFGISFDGNADLRNLYLPGEFEGHPLRKEFPLLARVVKPWPGIVDVEPMPGEDADDDADAGDGGDA